MNEFIVLTLAGIGLISLACQWLAWWVKLPAILFLLVAGIIAGPVTGWLHPDELFGDLLFPFVSLSVAVVLFEGGLTLKLRDIRGLGRVVRNLVTIGLLVTWGITAIATWYFLDFSWEISLLFGALAVVTGPTVITPLLRTVRPNAAVTSVLRWEGIMIDPIGAFLAVLVFEFIISGQSNQAIGHTVIEFGRMLLTGVLFGGAMAQALGSILRRHLLPEYLHNIATLTLVFGSFALSNQLIPESGLLTVTVMGMWLTNMRDVHVDEILNFKESLSVLLISGLFVILAARVEFSQFVALGWPALGVLLAIMFVARPLKVLVSTVGSPLTWQERTLLSWIAPRGIVAAAISALFALKLQGPGFEQAPLLVPLTFMVIIGTVVAQSATAGILARALGVAEPEPRGFLIIGANPVARCIGRALVEQEFHVLLADTSWDNIRAARMEGLPTFYGNAVSEHADRHLNLVGIGRLLALSPRREFNLLACLRYRREFGRGGIFLLQAKSEPSSINRHQMAIERQAHVLFGKDISFSKLSSLLSQGADIHTTTLTESYDFAAFSEQHGRGAIPLFALDGRGRIHWFTADRQTAQPDNGWTVISLVQSPEPAPGKA